MIAREFIDAASGHSVVDVIDDAMLRASLVEQFAKIHAQVECAHSPGEAYVLADAVLRLRADGVIVECGCFRGGMTAKLSHACRITGRTLVVCDSFRGLPTPTFHGGVYNHFESRPDVVGKFGPRAHFVEGQYSGSRAEVGNNVRTLGCIDVCRFVEGWFHETLPSVEDAPALVTIDVDLIESARTCLRWLWPRLTGAQFFTHEAFIRSYMDGILDSEWWQAELGEDTPEVIGVGTGINPHACCTAVLMKPRDS